MLDTLQEWSSVLWLQRTPTLVKTKDLHGKFAGAEISLELNCRLLTGL
jgi:hypothetical protein